MDKNRIYRGGLIRQTRSGSDARDNRRPTGGLRVALISFFFRLLRGKRHWESVWKTGIHHMPSILIFLPVEMMRL